MDTDVIVAGAGPVGLMLATELALAGARVIVVEKLPVRSGQSKAMNLQPRTAEVLNLGVQDAMNLGWKLAAVVAGRRPESPLDTYQAERHPIAAAVLANTQAQGVLRIADVEHRALLQMVAELLAVPAAGQRVAAMMSGLGIDYGGPGHVGARLPDFRIGADWASEVFHSGHGVLLATDEQHLTPAKPWADRVTATLVEQLPWPDVAAVLVRPDGYACWTAPGEPVTTALRTWFGDPDYAVPSGQCARNVRGRRAG